MSLKNVFLGTTLTLTIKADKQQRLLEKNINNELCKVHTWLCANRLSLNIDKSNFVIFHPPQKNLQGLKFNLKINDQQLNREFFIKYLGIMVDSNLNWKKHEIIVVNIDFWNAARPDRK